MLGEVLGAIGGIVGGLFGKSSAEKAAEKQAQLQREFAQNGIRWKVADAQAAGIHPLYALGASTAQYSPVSVGGESWADIGQNVGRAAGAMATGPEKADAFTRTVQGLTLDKMGLENEILRSQLRLANAPGTGPGQSAGYGSVIDGQQGQSLTVGGQKILINPNTVDAEKGEQRYGEIGGEIIGLIAGINDMLKTTEPYRYPKASSRTKEKIYQQNYKYKNHGYNEPSPSRFGR